jgi:hypothetical protein
MTNAEILKRLSKAHHWIQHGAVNKTGEPLDNILEGINEAYQIIDKLNTLDRLEKKVRQLEKQLLLQK